MYGEVYCSYEDITQVTGRLKAAVARRVVKTTEPLGRWMLKTYQCSGLKLERFFSFYRPAQTEKFENCSTSSLPLSPWLCSSWPSIPLAACPHEVCADSWEEDRGRVVPRNCGSGLLCALPCWENYQNQITTLLKIWTSGFVLKFYTHVCDKYCADLYIFGANLLVYSKLTDSFLHWTRFSIFERKLHQLLQPHDHKKSP